jgi:hypothetical protein
MVDYSRLTGDINREARPVSGPLARSGPHSPGTFALRDSLDASFFPGTGVRMNDTRAFMETISAPERLMDKHAIKLTFSQNSGCCYIELN